MKKYPFIILNLLIITLVLVILFGQRHQKVEQETNEELAVSYISEANEREGQKKKLGKLLEQTIAEELPGVVAWGDSLTYGSGGEGVTYPKVLQNLIEQNVYPNIPVVNMGVRGETSSTIVGRAGGTPFVVSSFTIPKEVTKVEIHITSSTGEPVAPLRQGDRGMNPVTINGVQGIISIDQQSKEENIYYFERLQRGEAVQVEDGTVIETAAMGKFKNYLPIVFVGQNGGYKTNQQLVDQIKSVIQLEKYNENYLVLGLTTGTAESRIQLESLMETTFGEKYVNLRELISTNGLKLANITPTTEDLMAMETGAIPPSLLSDKVHFNAKGYEVIGKIVFDRMKQLGYFDSVKQLAEKLNAI